MEEIFKKVFKNYNPTDEQIKSFISDFTTGLAVTLLLHTPNLSPEEESKIDVLIKDGDIQAAMLILESKFNSREEWEDYVKAQTTALFTNYIQTVVPA